MFSDAIPERITSHTHDHSALVLLFRVIVRLVAHGDLLGPDLLAQLSVYAMPHRVGGRDGVVLKDPAQVVEQSGGGQEDIGTASIVEVIQKELGVLISL